MNCGGSGRVVVRCTRCDDHGRDETGFSCGTCHGDGDWSYACSGCEECQVRCGECHGDGTIVEISFLQTIYRPCKCIVNRRVR